MLHVEGPVPGMITLTVARGITVPGVSNGHHSQSGRDSASSLLTSSSGKQFSSAYYINIKYINLKWNWEHSKIKCVILKRTV